MQLIKNSTSAEDLLAYLQSKKGENLEKSLHDVTETTAQLAKTMPNATHTNHESSNIIPHLEDALNYLGNQHLPVDLEHNTYSIEPLHLPHAHHQAFGPVITSKALDLAETFPLTEPTSFSGEHHLTAIPKHIADIAANPGNSLPTRNQSSSDNTHQDAGTDPPTTTVTAATAANGRPLRRTAARAIERFNRAHTATTTTTGRRPSQSPIDEDTMSHSDSDEGCDDGYGDAALEKGARLRRYQETHASSKRRRSVVLDDMDVDASASADETGDMGRKRPAQVMTAAKNLPSSPRNTGAGNNKGKPVRTLQRKTYDAMIDPDLPPDEIRKLRRVLSNRESARRSRKRKALQISTLEEELQEAHAVIAQLREELGELRRAAAVMQGTMLG